jgi:phospholipid/cholesterol/gamma-HCH transport system ATP-binding protein
MASPLIEFFNVSKRFGDRTILDKVNLSVQEGETTTIIGKSGVGKSVTLKHIIGLLEPDGGEIRFKGKNIKMMNRSERKAMKRQFSYMFQNNALFDSMTIFENIALPLTEKTTLSKKDVEQRVMQKTDLLELSEVVNKYPSQISGGMQKRVALARALITEPEIVLFDEPTTGLDPIRKNAVLGMIAHYQKRFGFTAIVVSHEIPDVFFISNRIAIIYDGRIIFQGSPFQLEQFDHPIIEEFINSLRSLKDELTGLETRDSFERQYKHEFSPVGAMEEFTVLLLSVENLESVERAVGRVSSQRIIQTLASLIDKHVGVMGISARYSRHEILSVLPHTDRKRAEVLLDEVAKEMAEMDVFKADSYPKSCQDFYVRAGLANGRPGTELSAIVELAKSQQTLLTGLKCEIEGVGSL